MLLILSGILGHSQFLPSLSTVLSIIIIVLYFSNFSFSPEHYIDTMLDDQKLVFICSLIFDLFTLDGPCRK